MNSIATLTPPIPVEFDQFDATEIYYPESDGEPMGETDFHIDVILYLKQALRHLFREASQTYVAANMFFYYEKGNPAAVSAPDAFVVKGISKHQRRTYKLWEEGVVPCAIFEITSRKTYQEDFGNKKKVYQKLGVAEYFMFDPLGERLSPRLQGFRLQRGFYRPLPLSAEGTLYSQELDIILCPQGDFLKLLYPTTGEAIPTLDEAIDWAYLAQEKAAQESLRAEQEAQHAKQETLRAEQEALRAEQEALRADAAEAELAHLRAVLKRLQREE